MNDGFGLVLSGGAALGFAHLGVLKFLEQNSLVPKYITGTSMGALIGALFSMGKSTDEIIELLDEFNIFKIADLKLMPFMSESILKSDKVNCVLKELFNEALIEDLKIKFGCVAVDSISCEICELTKGYVWEAVRASISVPAIFEPFEIDNKKFIDGGVMDNLPTELAKKIGAEKVIAINVIDYSNALISKKSLIAALINSITLSQKELVRVKTNCDLLVQLHLKDVQILNFCKDNALNAYVQGYEEVKSAYAEQIIKLFK